MSNQINDGGPAFPHKRQIRCNGEVIDSEMEPGMTLRDYFAAASLQGLMANPECNKTWDESDVAKFCYEMSNEMLKAREVKP